MQRMFAIIVVALAALAHPVRAASTQAATSQSSYAEDASQRYAAQANHVVEASSTLARPDHERLFIAIFDCSWKNASKGPSEPTTVRQIYRQLQGVEKLDSRLHAEYVETDCARDNWFASAEQGRSIVKTRVGQMYRQLAVQSARWFRQDPQARITLLDVGGSWGAVQAAEFSMEVHRRGLQNLDAGTDDRVAAGDVLVAPGQTAQAIALLDPVGAADPDLRLPASVISGIQFTAMDEHRHAFKSAQIIGRGASADGRFMGLFVPGAHSDVCGGYFRDGLSIRTANFLIDYINGLSNTPLLKKLFEPTDPRLNVIHHSEDEGA